MLLSRKFNKEHPKPSNDFFYKNKRPKMTDPKYLQENSNLVDFKLYDVALAKYEKKRKNMKRYIEKNYGNGNIKKEIIFLI